MIGMGGAYTAVPSDYQWMFYNPAAFLYFHDETKNVSFIHISLPNVARVLGFMGKQFYDTGYEADNKKTKKSFNEVGSQVLALFTMLKPVYTTKYFAIGLAPTEDLLIDNQYFGNRTTLAGSVRPVRWFALGLSGHYIYIKKISYYNFFPDKTSDEYRWGFGFTGGVNFEPVNNFTIGATYFHTKKSLSDAFLDRERFANRTINFGTSYQINMSSNDGFVKLAFDLRNPFFSSKEAFLEPHLGIQIFRSILSSPSEDNAVKNIFLAGLVGWFYHRDLKNNWVSAGLKFLLQTKGFLYELTLSSQFELSNRNRFFVFIKFSALKVYIGPVEPGMEGSDRRSKRRTIIN
jgi:hypothetical protein